MKKKKREKVFSALAYVSAFHCVGNSRARYLKLARRISSLSRCLVACRTVRPDQLGCEVEAGVAVEAEPDEAVEGKALGITLGVLRCRWSF